MPEGDNIHRHEAELRPLLVGEPLERAFIRGLLQPALKGRRIEAIAARGKHLLLTVEGGVTLRVHLGIAGYWRRVDPTQLGGWQIARAPLVLVTRTIALVCGRARAVEVLRTAFVHEQRALAALGPDLLGEAVDLEEVLRRARRPEHRGQSLAELLLDQRVASGLGNVYKSELCFLHRVSPFRAADTVDDATLRAIYDDGRRLLAANVGPWPRTTTADRSRGFLPARGRGRYHVFGRARRPCPSCGTPIELRMFGRDPRRTYFCPRCQPE